LDASSEINANPKDTADHPGGVWNLLPNLRNIADEDKVAIAAIGESDRMTLRFVKE
jgi:predicted methyltransferase